MGVSINADFDARRNDLVVIFENFTKMDFSMQINKNTSQIATKLVKLIMPRPREASYRPVARRRIPLFLMKRIEEKVKDIVEVRPFTQLHDFAVDPARTLESYHFTDITADLMANWISRVTQCKSGNGVAAALAGFRGVGKSHFLSTFAAILSEPELRSRIVDEHVSSISQGLLRRHFQVAFIRRGSGTDLIAELKTGISGAIGVTADVLGHTSQAILEKAAEHTGDSPLILLFDTAAGRESRVSRDDGQILSEIATTAKEIGFFVGVALDDDISGADGPNSTISANFSIDYLYS